MFWGGPKFKMTADRLEGFAGVSRVYIFYLFLIMCQHKTGNCIRFGYSVRLWMEEAELSAAPETHTNVLFLGDF